MNSAPFNFNFKSHMEQIKNKSTYDSCNESTQIGLESLSSQVTGFQETKIETQIRKMCRRKGLSTSDIGEHPDFKNLSDEADKYQYICPLFIDIKGSTQLSLKYDLKFVKEFKNLVIRTCIEVVRAFGGFVHRIMGDAVLVFFGHSEMSKEQAVIDTLNASAFLNYFLLYEVKPYLSSLDVTFADSGDFGFRIGCNFGDKNDVLWSHYGYFGTGEVSPTGFPIDIASKLQSLADKNTIMLGQGLLEKMNFPKQFCKIKEDYKGEKELYTTPNYTKLDGKPVNYKMRLFLIDEYFKGIFIKTSIKKDLIEEVTSNDLFNLTVEYRHNNTVYDFKSETVIPKESLIFITLLTNNLPVGRKFRVEFIKTNYSGFDNEPSLLEYFIQNKEDKESYEINAYERNQQKVVFERNCEFKGIHRVEINVYEFKEIVFRDFINVPIQ